VVQEDTITLNFVMPEMKDLEEPDRALGDEQTPAEEGLSVPTLADVPTQVDLSQAFIQQIDYSTLVPKQDLSAARTLAIPVHYSHGTRIGEGMEKIFNLSDLDRAPEALVKIAPSVPLPLKQAGTHVVVTVLFVVDANGAVRTPEIFKTDDTRFNETALIAMAKWKFRPGIKNGRRVNVRMMQPMIFEVKASD
jgi:protein TonB